MMLSQKTEFEAPKQLQTPSVAKFVQSMKSLYEEQKQEIDKAVVGVGEYQLSSAYLSHGVQAKDGLRRIRSKESVFWIDLGRPSCLQQSIILICH